MQLLELAEAAFAGKPRAPHVHLAQALDRGGEPGKAVRGVLGVVDAAGLGDFGAHARLGRLQNLVGRGDGAFGALQQRFGTG